MDYRFYHAATFWTLRPLRNGWTAEDVRLLSAWREREAVWAFSKFKVTDARTEAWLKKISADDSIRFFMIDNPDGIPVGHIGLQNLNPPNAEVGYVMRGDPNAPKGLMHAAVMRIMGHALNTHQCRHFTARVWSDNIRSLNLFYGCGFKATSTRTFWYHPTAEGHEWNEEPYGTSVTRTEITLEREMD